jgi:hypothetical protein
MWDKLFEYGKQILSLTKRVDENTSDIKELRASAQQTVPQGCIKRHTHQLFFFLSSDHPINFLYILL